MAKLEDFKKALEQISAEELIEKIKSKEGRQQLLTADLSFGYDAEATTAVIDAIPTSVLADREDLKEIFEGLLEIEHAPRWKAIVSKLSEFDRDQINAHPWLQDFLHSPTVKNIHNHQEISEALSKYLQEISYQNEAANFFGKPIGYQRGDEYIQAISEMDPAETLKALQDPDKFMSLTKIGAQSGDSGALVAACVTHIPAEQWPDGQNLIDTFQQILSTKTPLALEAIATKIEEMSSQKLAQSADEIRQYIHSPQVTQILYSKEKTSRISRRVANASRENEISSFLTPTDPTIGDSAPNAPTSAFSQDRAPQKSKPAMKPAPKTPVKRLGK